MPERSFDAVVLGAGPAGEVCAGQLASGGLDVAIVECHLLGGECSYYACMPSKGLLRPGELITEARRIPGVEEAVDGGLDARAVLARRNEIIHDLDDEGQVGWLEGQGIEIFRGQGRLDGERRVRVGDDVLVARRAVVVATGSDAAMPPIDGLRGARHWTNREATTAKEPPGRLAVIGGGVSGVELAQAWRSLGSEVALVHDAERLIAREEPFAGEQVADALREAGVDLRLGARASAVRERDGELVLELDDGEPVTADELLVAIGRTPRTRDIGLETVGLEPGEAIAVDETLRAEGSNWLYAIGDVNKRVELTHMGKYQARVVAESLLGHDVRIAVDGGRSPRVIFTDPQVAAVGHTLASAREAGIDATAIDVGTQANAAGSFYGRDSAGTTRFVVDEERRVLAGATFTGFEVAEFVHAATVAVVGEVPLERLRHAVPSFPTRSEVWLTLFAEYGL